MCKEDTVIPGNTELIVKGEGKKADFDKRYAVISPSQLFKCEGMLVGNTLLNTRVDTDIPVRMMNTNTEEIKVKRGTVLGYLNEVEDSDISIPMNNAKETFDRATW